MTDRGSGELELILTSGGTSLGLRAKTRSSIAEWSSCTAVGGSYGLLARAYSTIFAGCSSELYTSTNLKRNEMKEINQSRESAAKKNTKEKQKADYGNMNVFLSRQANVERTCSGSKLITREHAPQHNTNNNDNKKNIYHQLQRQQ